MKIVYILLALTGMWAAGLRAQNCADGRYWNEVFSNFTLQSDIVYGQNVNANGQNQQLKFDLYTPTGDAATDRPLVIMAHGGSFIGGDKTQAEVTQFCKALAKRGYVCASIQYRIGLNFATDLNETGLLKAVVRAVHDGKALVRFFHKSVVEDANPYGIDTTKMFFGGSSAGAFLALHLQYMDKIEEFAEMGNPSIIDVLGGVDGNSGSPGYTSTVDAVINLCGAMGKAHWLESGDVPVFNVGASADRTVPYAAGSAGVAPILLPVEGAKLIHDRGLDVAVNSQLLTFWGADHVPYAPGQNPNSAAYFDTTLAYVVENLYPLVCSGPPPTRRRVQLVHASPDPVLAPADVYINGQALASNVAFKTASAPIDLAPWTDEATFTLSVAPAGGGTVHQKTVTLSGTNVDAYVVVAGTLGDVDFPLDFYVKEGAIFDLTDNDKAYYRVFHGASAPAVDVLAGGAPVVSNLAFGHYNDAYLVLPSGDYVVGIAPAGSAEALASFDVAATAGTAALVVAIGEPGRDFGLYAGTPAGGELAPLPAHTTSRAKAVAPYELSVYPNPAADVLHFSAGRIPESLTIFDAHGRAVHTLRPEAGTFALSVADFTPGLYVYRATGGAVGKFVVAR